MLMNSFNEIVKNMVLCTLVRSFMLYDHKLKMNFIFEIPLYFHSWDKLTEDMTWMHDYALYKKIKSIAPLSGYISFNRILPFSLRFSLDSEIRV